MNKMKYPKAGETRKLKAMYPGDRLSGNEVIRIVIFMMEENTGVDFVSLYDKTEMYYYRYR